MDKKKIAILGSTGSIGVNTLKVADHLGFEVKALAAHQNIDLLEIQAKEWRPELIAVYDQTKALELQKRLPQFEIVAGMEGLEAVAADSSAGLVVSAIAGTMGILPTVAAVKVGKDVALANKEVLVSAGEYLTKLKAKTGSKILPIDSEHSALFQCLQGQRLEEVRRIILTASGGPFRCYSEEKFTMITVEDALVHPSWRMGAKVTIDCSTLMNKGLEVIEAHWLFGVSVEQIEVVIHPQSVIHSMVEFIDGSMMAQLSEPNMIIPIQYALTYPHHQPGLLPPFDFTKARSLDFLPPDLEKFYCLELAFHALKEKGTLPCYMNAANEVLVDRFLKKEISWLEIGRKLAKLMTSHKSEKGIDLEKILAVDKMAREEATEA